MRQHQVRALVADDDPDICDLLVLRLRASGLKVSAVTTGPQALQVYGSEPLDLLLLDVGMPGMSGLEVTRQVRRDGHTTPVVLVSAYADVASVQAGLDAGANAYLCKPFTGAALRAVLDELVSPSAVVR